MFRVQLPQTWRQLPVTLCCLTSSKLSSLLRSKQTLSESKYQEVSPFKPYGYAVAPSIRFFSCLWSYQDAQSVRWVQI